MKTIYVKPRPGVQVRDPRTAQPIPEKGAEVPQNSYWLRRLRDGDVTEGKPPRKGRQE